MAKRIRYTEVDEAVEFVERTGVDSLAIGVGTSHGVYKGTPHIAVDRIREIAYTLSAYFYITAMIKMYGQVCLTFIERPDKIFNI